MDMTKTIEPKSDQLDAVDLVSGPRTFTIERVSAGNSEQPVNIHLVGFPRVWRPSKSMRRVLVAAWGTDGSRYAGRSVTLFCNPDIMFGGIKVGGIQISHVSHIDKPLAVALLVKRGQSSMFTVKPIEAPVPSPAAQVTQAFDATPMVATALPEQIDRIKALVAEQGLTPPAAKNEIQKATGRKDATTANLTWDEAESVIAQLAAEPQPEPEGLFEGDGMTPEQARAHVAAELGAVND